MALTFFEVQATLLAAITDTSGDPDGDPDIQNISSTVTFTPSVQQVYSSTDHKVYRLAKIKGRTNPDDGILRTVDGNPVTLVANTSDLDVEELTYKVEFSNVVYDATSNNVIEPLRFVAPTDDTPVDLATVDRL